MTTNHIRASGNSTHEYDGERLTIRRSHGSTVKNLNRSMECFQGFTWCYWRNHWTQSATIF